MDTVPQPQPPDKAGRHRFANKARKGSEKEAVLGKLRGRGLIQRHKVEAKFGAWRANFPAILFVLANPLHPDNQWKYLVDQIEIDGEVYLHAVESIEVSVLQKWTTTQRDPRRQPVRLSPGGATPSAEPTMEASSPHLNDALLPDVGKFIRRKPRQRPSIA